MTASDADDPATGNNARLLYSLLQGQAYFSVEPTTGIFWIRQNAIWPHFKGGKCQQKLPAYKCVLH